LAEARTRLTAAVERLEARLQQSPAEAAGWRAYLKFDDLKQQLAQATPDLPAFDGIHARFAAGYDGLGLVWFADVRDALRAYLTTARTMGDPKLPQQYETLLDSLAQRLEAYQKTPSADNAAAISRALGWLRDAGQAPQLVADVQRLLSHPNVFVTVSAPLVHSRLERSVDEVTPVQDCILGTTIQGTAHATGNVRGALAPSEGQAIIEALFEGSVASQNVGYNGPATIYSTGQTTVGARKQILLNAEGFFGMATCSRASTSTNIYCIDTGGRELIERLAWRRAAKQKGQAEEIASRHAEQRFNGRFDEQSEPLVAKANDGFQKRFRRPLTERRLFPESFVANSTPESLGITVMTTGETGLGAPTAPPELAGAPDLAVRTHESSVNNLTASGLAGAIVDEKRFDEITTRFLGLPERIGKDQDHWAITFARHQPVTVEYGDRGFSVTIRGSQYMNEGRDYPAMNVTARYRIEQTPRGFRAVRQGPMEIFPPGFAPGSGQQLSAREQTLRTVLQKRFARFFEEEVIPKNIVMAADTPKPIELRLAHWDAFSGWMVMTWQKVAASQPAAQAAPVAAK
jgi:hypothetical protein